jgi:hypothetical protein
MKFVVIIITVSAFSHMGLSANTCYSCHFTSTMKSHAAFSEIVEDIYI